MALVYLVLFGSAMRLDGAGVQQLKACHRRYGKARFKLRALGAFAAAALLSIVCVHPAVCEINKMAGTPNILMSRSDLVAVLHSSSPAALAALDHLQARVRNIVDQPDAYAIPVTGCNLGAYRDGFSITPNGAAPALAALATYVYAFDVGGGWGDAELASAARRKALQMIQAWSARGFAANGQPIETVATFCGIDNYPPATSWSLAALQVGRGMVYWVQGLDLLRVDVRNAGLEPVADAFVRRQLKIVEQSSAVRAGSRFECERYDNQVSMGLLATAMMGAYLSDHTLLAEIAGQGVARLPVTWPQQVDGTIYGAADTPRGCYGGLPRHGYFQTPVVAPGEMVDRFRNADYQAFGYTMGSLTSLILTAQVLKNAGYDVWSYHGAKSQSVTLALDYYGPYFLNYLSADKTSLPNTGDLADFAQYAGKAFTRADSASPEDKDGLISPFLLALRLDPNCKIAGQVVAKATSLARIRSFSGVDLLFIDALAILPLPSAPMFRR